MNVDFRVRQVEGYSDLMMLRRFLHEHDLGYVGYHDWIESICIPEIEKGDKNAVIALHDEKIIGNIVWQHHKELPRTVEVKNLRIHPMSRERGLAYFLMKQCEAEIRKEVDIMIADFPSDQTSTGLFLLNYGFGVLYQAPIYEDDSLHTVVVKPLRKVV